jgi:uncharacterized membrane-anchored protein YhcB (DUF1043 family)
MSKKLKPSKRAVRKQKHLNRELRKLERQLDVALREVREWRRLEDQP